MKCRICEAESLWYVPGTDREGGTMRDRTAEGLTLYVGSVCAECECAGGCSANCGAQKMVPGVVPFPVESDLSVWLCADCANAVALVIANRPDPAAVL